MNKQKVAEIVRHYIKDCHPHGMTLSVIEQEIRKGKSWWDMPIRLSMDPPNQFTRMQTIHPSLNRYQSRDAASRLDRRQTQRCGVLLWRWWFRADNERSKAQRTRGTSAKYRNHDRSGV